MTGYHAVSLMADAISKGIADFDIDKAKRAAIRSAIYNPDSICASPRIRDILSPISKKYKNELGFGPWDAEKESVAKGLEYAYDDHCIAVMAEKMGKKEIAEDFRKRSGNYRNLFNRENGFMQPRDSSGSWQSGFTADEYTPHISESNAWHYLWSVQHDIPGLMNLMGKERFMQRLDSMFTYTPASDKDLPIFSTGMIGQYVHGNEPSHHVIFLYNMIGQPWKTAYYARKVMIRLVS